MRTERIWRSTAASFYWTFIKHSDGCLMHIVWLCWQNKFILCRSDGIDLCRKPTKKRNSNQRVGVNIQILCSTRHINRMRAQRMWLQPETKPKKKPRLKQIRNILRFDAWAHQTVCSKLSKSSRWLIFGIKSIKNQFHRIESLKRRVWKTLPFQHNRICVQSFYSSHVPRRGARARLHLRIFRFFFSFQPKRIFALSLSLCLVQELMNYKPILTF